MQQQTPQQQQRQGSNWQQTPQQQQQWYPWPPPMMQPTPPPKNWKWLLIALFVAFVVIGIAIWVQGILISNQTPAVVYAIFTGIGLIIAVCMLIKPSRLSWKQLCIPVSIVFVAILIAGVIDISTSISMHPQPQTSVQIFAVNPANCIWHVTNDDSNSAQPISVQMPQGCTAVLDSSSGSIIGKTATGEDFKVTWKDNGGIVAIPAGTYSGWFSQGDLITYVADQAYDKYCRRLQGGLDAHFTYHIRRPLLSWAAC